MEIEKDYIEWDYDICNKLFKKFNHLEIYNPETELINNNIYNIKTDKGKEFIGCNIGYHYLGKQIDCYDNESNQCIFTFKVISSDIECLLKEDYSIKINKELTEKSNKDRKELIKQKEIKKLETEKSNLESKIKKLKGD